MIDSKVAFKVIADPNHNYQGDLHGMKVRAQNLALSQEPNLLKGLLALANFEH